MRIAQLQFTGIGGVAAVANSLILSDRDRKASWTNIYYGVESISQEHIQFCQSNNILSFVVNPCKGFPFWGWVLIIKYLFKIRPQAILCHSSSCFVPCGLYSIFFNVQFIAVEHTQNNVKSLNEWLNSAAGMFFAKKVVVITSKYREELKQLLGPIFISKKIAVIPNGVIASDAFPPKPRLISCKSIQLLRAGMAARFVPSKRFDLLIRVASNLGFQLELAGDGETMEHCRNLVNQHKANIKFLGMLNQNDLIEWLKSLDVYLHASEGETFCVSMIQAMYAGLPVIASDLLDLRLIYGTANAMLVSNNITDWQNAVCYLFDNPDSAARMARRGQDLVLSKYGSDKMLKLYLGLLS